jgi:hypothetical protein
MKKPKAKNPTKIENKEKNLTKEEFFRVLNRVIQPVKVKPTTKEKKGTSG